MVWLVSLCVVCSVVKTVSVVDSSCVEMNVLDEMSSSCVAVVVSLVETAFVDNVTCSVDVASAFDPCVVSRVERVVSCVEDKSLASIVDISVVVAGGSVNGKHDVVLKQKLPSLTSVKNPKRVIIVSACRASCCSHSTPMNSCCGNSDAK